MAEIKKPAAAGPICGSDSPDEAGPPGDIGVAARLFVPDPGETSLRRASAPVSVAIPP